MGADPARHWEQVWADRDPTEVSWHQPVPSRSLALLQQVAPDRDARIVDVGGGASTLVDHLLDEGYRDVTVVDVAAQALERARERLGARAAQVRWVTADATTLDLGGPVDVWHDRAVLHFLTDDVDRDRYLDRLRAHVPVGGHAVLATFSLDGPETCSGLPVRRHDAAGLAAAAGPDLTLVTSVEETHRTPAGHPQAFVYVVLRRHR
jgi:2-polyprenyl-3-methyl-5-hydroxy-6-metoxy-1,4-benzoquinol methylase